MATKKGGLIAAPSWPSANSPPLGFSALEMCEGRREVARLFLQRKLTRFSGERCILLITPNERDLERQP